MTADKALTKDEFAEKWGKYPITDSMPPSIRRIEENNGRHAILSDLNALLRAELIKLLNNEQVKFTYGILPDEKVIDNYLNRSNE